MQLNKRTKNHYIMIPKQMKNLSALFLLILSLGYAQAETKRYDVEILIFEDAHANYINSEEWRQQVGDFKSSNGGAANYSSIKPYILTSSYKRIKASSNYNVLFYGGWRQTGLSKRSAFTISLDQLKNRHNTKSDNTISGDLKLVLARYLHLYGDLDYQRSDFIGSRAEYYQDSNRFPITFHSRMRSKELHFVDHPLVGILIQINPVKKKATTSAQPTKEPARKPVKDISTKKQAGS